MTILVFQTTGLVLLFRYSRSVPSDDGSKYLVSTTVVLSEVIKVITSLAILYYQSNFHTKEVAYTVRRELAVKWKESVKSAIPALSYTINNNLTFIALSHLDSVTFQVTYQLKIFVTAIFSILMLKKRLTSLQWFSMVMLVSGVTLIQLPDPSSDMESEKKNNDIIGLICVLIAAFLSGFTGVYFEKILKKGGQSLWIRNLQLSVASSIIAIIGSISQDWATIREKGFFCGYSTLTWTIILVHSYGGFLVSGVMKYADNILKGYATSISIVLSTFLSYFFMDDFKPNFYTWFGGSTVLLAVITYNM